MTRMQAFRRSAVVIAAGLVVGAVSCASVDELLEAENPGAINEAQLNDAALINVLTNSVVGAITNIFHDPLIWRGSMITDEQISGINWEGTARISQRILPYTAGDANAMFGGLSRYRYMADSVASRFRTLLQQPTRDRNMALVLAHAGYAYTLMAEYVCEATINVGDKIYTPRELVDLAIPRFEEAITVATAVGTSSDDIRNLARTGLARAALLKGDKAKVMSAAGAVPQTFTWWIQYLDQVADNGMQGNVTGANHNLGVHPRWVNGTFGTQNLRAAQTDPRIQHNVNWRLGHNALTRLYTPYQSLPYGEFNRSVTIAAGGTPALYDDDTDIKFASGVEAMHHYYEAAGPTGTGPMGTTLEFVNSRRAFGNQTAVTLTGDALMSELRTQRFKDMFMGGFRLGDLRRYAAQGINDPLHTFPSGQHPNVEWGNYGDATCWPLPLNEFVGNPNIRR
ncbi:MAG: hypothetical protein ACRENP_10345 [Longimicrobiales bacterium]